EQLLAVLDAGRLAGSAKNRQPWRFIVVREAQTRAGLATCGRYATHLAKAPVVIVVVMPGDRFWDGFDAGRAAQNMMVAATDLGMGTGIATLHDADCVQRLLALPAGHNAQIAIALGVPAAPQPTAEEREFVRAVLPQVGRKSLSELVHYGRWGQQTPRNNDQGVAGGA
ncbi:MAG TPA: hypothetical protein DEP84_01625, partial [Chloroflexi bacterium]|nr:hypothetical protein [Chloroflexota bacterium]